MKTATMLSAEGKSRVHRNLIIIINQLILLNFFELHISTSLQ